MSSQVNQESTNDNPNFGYSPPKNEFESPKRRRTEDTEIERTKHSKTEIESDFQSALQTTPFQSEQKREQQDDWDLSSFDPNYKEPWAGTRDQFEVYETSRGRSKDDERAVKETPMSERAEWSRQQRNTERRQSRFTQKLLETNPRNIVGDNYADREDLVQMPAEDEPRYRSYARKDSSGTPRQEWSPRVKRPYSQHDTWTPNRTVTPFGADFYSQEAQRAPPPGGGLIPGVTVTISNPIPTPPKSSYPSRDKEREQRKEEFVPREKSDVPTELATLENQRVAFKLQASRIVVKRLKYYFDAGRVENKEDFKHLSRKFVHKIIKKEEKNKFIITQKTPSKIEKLIDNYFVKHPGVYQRKKKSWEKPPELQ